MKSSIAIGILLLSLCSQLPGAEVVVANVNDLRTALQASPAGTEIVLKAGTYELDSALKVGSGITLRGAGIDQTTLVANKTWQPAGKSLPDPEMKRKGLDETAYLLVLADDAQDIRISDLTLHGPTVHGAIFAWFSQNLVIERVRIKETMWSGIRTFGMKKSKILDCEFIDAGGRWERGEPGIKGGITGGAIFPIWMQDCEIAHNRFTRTREEKQHEFYGIKCRQGKRCRVHHNTIDVNFSIEFPFENDEDVEIDHNLCTGTISLPKHAGGPVPESGRTFHLHHNWLRDTYSIEFVRNGIEIDHNLFEFDPAKDHGNLISGFGQAAAKGPASFHHNLVSNPGRGVIWINEVYNNLEIYRNHIIARTTKTPRVEGLFGFNTKADFSTISLRDNIIECEGQARPLFRNKESYSAKLENNRYTNVSDAAQLKDQATKNSPGLEEPLKFTCGVHDEWTIDGWKTTRTNQAVK